MALLTALMTSAAVTSLVTWTDVTTDSRPTSVSGDNTTGAFDVTTSVLNITRPHTTSNDHSDFGYTTMTSQNYFRLLPSTRRPVDHLLSERVAITRSIRLYGIVVAACVGTVVAVALAAVCVISRGGPLSSVHCSSWLRRFKRHATSDLATSAGSTDSDYIYRPLGSATGSRLDDEYETTFVGVSVPLLHDVRAV